MPVAPVSVVVVEDQPGTRDAFAASLRLGGFEVRGAYGGGAEAIREVPRLAPDVALVDLGLPDVSGLEVIRRLKAALPDLAVLVLTVFDDAERVVAAIRAGAGGYLLKGTPPGEVAEAILQVREGRAPLSPEIAGHVLARLRRGPPDPSDEPLDLSERELEVLTLLARGHAYADIATALGVQLSTIQSHVRNVYRKLEVSSKAEAATIAVRHGLLE